jgi:hypothetical protein
MRAAGACPSAAATRAAVRVRQEHRDRRSNRVTVARPTPAFPASSAADRPCWRRNCRNLVPFTTVNHRSGVRAGLGVPGVMVAHFQREDLG